MVSLTRAASMRIWRNNSDSVCTAAKRRKRKACSWSDDRIMAVSLSGMGLGFNLFLVIPSDVPNQALDFQGFVHRYCPVTLRNHVMRGLGHTA